MPLEMNREVFITCAVTGSGGTQDRSEHVPRSPREIADAAIEAARAGAAIVHCHVRDPETGQPGRDVGHFREVTERIRDSEVDVVVNLTAGMGGDLVLGSTDRPLPLSDAGTDMASAEERVAHVAECRPEICTLDCGTMNFAEADYIMVNTPGMLRAMAGLMQELGVRVEVEAFETGHLWFAKQLVREGLIDAPVMVQLCMGIPWGAPDDLNTFLAMVNNVPDDWVFSAFSISRNEMPYVAAAVLAGGNVRVGLEDNLYLERGVLATNAQLVEKARRIVEKHGRQGPRPRRSPGKAATHQACAAMSEARKAAIIGGGVIGGGWTARFLLNGWDVAVYDPDPDAERKIGEVLANARRSLPSLYDFSLPDEGRLDLVTNINDAVGGARWIQESVPERLDVKCAVYRDIQAHAPADAVLASSTSGFKPSELCEGAVRPEQILVVHPFNPVYLLPLVEVVPSPCTDGAIRDRAVELMRGVGMYPLLIRKEIDGHVNDRLQEALWREALWLVSDGIATTREIDDSIRFGCGLRWAQMGSFQTFWLAGGEGGMRHFMAQFGPALKWPWTKLMDVPELTDTLIDTIADQCDQQSGGMTPREMERVRDNNLVGMMRALKRTRLGCRRHAQRT